MAHIGFANFRAESPSRNLCPNHWFRPSIGPDPLQDGRSLSTLRTCLQSYGRPLCNDLLDTTDSDTS